MKPLRQLQVDARGTNAVLSALEAGFTRWRTLRAPDLTPEQRGRELDEWIVNLSEARHKQAFAARELAAATTQNRNK